MMRGKLGGALSGAVVGGHSAAIALIYSVKRNDPIHLVISGALLCALVLFLVSIILTLVGMRRGKVTS